MAFGNGGFRLLACVLCFRVCDSVPILSDNPLVADFSSTTNQQLFEGFGTSLCWWAVGVGGWTNQTAFDELMDLIFLPSELGLIQARYNIGGSGKGDTQLSHFRPGAWVEAYETEVGVWNPSADATQRRVLQAALARGVKYVQANSNSPPYWMTVSGSSTGSKSGTSDNLRSDEFQNFANYLANVTSYFKTKLNITFDSVTPLNEAGNGWWKMGGSQEGCHFEPASENKIVTMLGQTLRSMGLTMGVSGPEENSIDLSLTNLQSYSAETIAEISVITTHTYNGNNRAGLAQFAAAQKKRLWASEFGTGSGPLQGGLALAARITSDLNELKPSVWTLWQAADLDNSLSPGGWGLTAATYCGCVNGDTCECASPNQGGYLVRMQYYSFKMFTAFIRPGSTIVTGNAGQPDNSVAAVTADGHFVVVVTNAASNNVGMTIHANTRYGTLCATWFLTDATHKCEKFSSVVLKNTTSNSTTLEVQLPSQSISTFVYDPSATCPPPPPSPPPQRIVTIRLSNISGLCLTSDTAGTNLTVEVCKVDKHPASMQLWSLSRDVTTPTPIMLVQSPESVTTASVSSVKAARSVKTATPGTRVTASANAGQPLCLTNAGESSALQLGDDCDGQTWRWETTTGEIRASNGPNCNWKYGDDVCCFDDWNNNQSVGGQVRTYSCWGGDNQRWALVDVQ